MALMGAKNADNISGLFFLIDASTLMMLMMIMITIIKTTL